MAVLKTYGAAVKFFVLLLFLRSYNVFAGNSSISFPTMAELHKILLNADGHIPFLPNAMTDPSNELLQERQMILDFYQRELQMHDDSPIFMYEYFTGKGTAPPSLNSTLVSGKFLYTITSFGSFVRGRRYPLKAVDHNFIKEQMSHIKMPAQSLLLEKNFTTSVKTAATRDMMEEMRTYPRCTYVTFWTAENISNSFVAPAFMPDIKVPESVPEDMISWSVFIHYFGELSQTRYEESDKISRRQGKIQIEANARGAVRGGSFLCFAPPLVRRGARRTGKPNCRANLLLRKFAYTGNA